ncbi:MAG: hypothetical protein RL199_1966 [Pseudomonadota bacterium]|jgi:hypothetical protein
MSDGQLAWNAATAEDSVDEGRQKLVGDYLAPGFTPTEVPSLDDLSRVRAFQPLLRELLLGGEDDFWVRLHVMRELAADSETGWTPDQLGHKFPHLADEPRRDVIRRLTRGGWIAFDENRYTITPLGESATALTSLLGQLAHKAGDLGVVVQTLHVATEFGLDSAPQLDQLRNKLARISEEIQKAYDSKSEHAILEARKMLESALPWVENARLALEKYDIDTPGEHERVRQTHELLSRLHRWVAVLQRALNDIGKRRIHLGDAGGLTERDITAFLAHSDVHTLVALADGVLHFPVLQRHVIVDNLLSEAEYELCYRELPEDERRGWSAPTAAEAVEPELEKMGPIEEFVIDVRGLLREGKPVQAAKFVARESWASTAYRFTLLGLAGGRMDVGDESAQALGPGRILATLPVDVLFDHRVRDRLDSEFASEMTSGRIVPRADAPSDSSDADDAEPGAEDET